MLSQEIIKQSQVVDGKYLAVMQAKNAHLRQGEIYEATKEIEELESEREKLNIMLKEGGYI